MSIFMVYAIMQLSNITLGILLLCIFYFVTTLIPWLDLADNCRLGKAQKDEPHAIQVKKRFKRGIIVLFICIGVMVFIPSTKTATLMYIIPKITNSESTQILIQNAPELMDALIKNLKN